MVHVQKVTSLAVAPGHKRLKVHAIGANGMRRVAPHALEVGKIVLHELGGTFVGGPLAHALGLPHTQKIRATLKVGRKVRPRALAISGIAVAL